MEPIDIEIKSFDVGYLRTNCYVVSDGEICVIVDPGGGFDTVKQYIDEKHFIPCAVLLTHGHFDHILALDKWKKLGLKVYIHSDDAKMLRNEWNLAKEVGLHDLPVVKPDVILFGGEKINFGKMTFEVIHTPGHTMGGCCFDLNERYLFSGDTILSCSYGRTDFYGGSADEIKKSINKIFSIKGDRIVYPGHGESTTLEWERIVNPINALI